MYIQLNKHNNRDAAATVGGERERGVWERESGGSLAIFMRLLQLLPLLQLLLTSGFALVSQTPCHAYHARSDHPFLLHANMMEINSAANDTAHSGPSASVSWQRN